jgi:hypothetical protein
MKKVMQGIESEVGISILSKKKVHNVNFAGYKATQKVVAQALDILKVAYTRPKVTHCMVVFIC